MKGKRISRNIFRLQQLQGEVARLIKEVSTHEPLTIGSLSEILRTCGKPTCRCAKKPCHRCLVLMTTYKDARRCQVVRKADRQNVGKKVQRYRRFREVLRRLRALDFERYALLKGILEERNQRYE